MSKLPVTAAGCSALEDELKHRIQVERVRLIQRIKDAVADDSNLVENSEYQEAKAEHEINEARIAELEDRLARAEIIDLSKLSGDIVKFGATVTLLDQDTAEKKVLQIVGEPEADPRKGRVSIASPVARALIGKAKGSAVEVEAPRGTKTYQILRVEWLDTAQRSDNH
jgi:transcription elongation factor GreA